MKNYSFTISRGRRLQNHRRGMAILYMSILLMTLTAVTSMAVDFGRWEMCKTQLQRAADAAARSGAFQLAKGASTSVSYATIVSWFNNVDAQTVLSNPNVSVTIQVLDWTSASNYTVLTSSNYSLANAIRVTLSYNVPLMFGSVIGISSKTATRSSTAVLYTTSQNIYVGANGNLWLAGEPTGTTGSLPDASWQGQGVNSDHKWQYDLAGPVGGTASDGEPYESPAQATISLVPGAILAVSSVTGGGTMDPSVTDGTADGTLNGSTAQVYDDEAAYGTAEHGIADVYMPIDSMMGVFLGSSLPTSSSAPAVLNFSTAAERDYSTLSPLTKQPFFIGNGETSGSSQQYIVVPQGATRLFLGMMDGHEWSNNAGGYNATITQYSVQTVQ
jgi:Flp pilus assembly protein TadG